MEEITGYQPIQPNISRGVSDGNREENAKLFLNFSSIAENIKAFKGKKIAEVFSDEEHKREFIENLDGEDFIELLNGLNGILRGKKKEDWNMDGENMIVKNPMMSGASYTAPNGTDAPFLFSKVLEASKKMNQENRSMEDIALLVASSINAIHAYTDGNGRTSRAVYLLLIKGFNVENSNDFFETLSTNGNEKININPGLISLKIDNLIEKEIGINNPKLNPKNIKSLDTTKGELPYNQDVSIQDKKQFKFILENDKDNVINSIFIFFKKNPDINTDSCLEKHPTISRILINPLIKQLSPEQLTKILQNYRQLKINYVEKLIESITNPDNEKYQIEDTNGQKISLLNYFRSEIKEKQEKNDKMRKLEQEEMEAIEQEKQRIIQEEKAIKQKFDNNQGEYKYFKASEIETLSKIEQGVKQISTENTSQVYTEKEKTDILKTSLLTLTKRLTHDISISQKQINLYIKENPHLIELFNQFQTINKMIDFLEKSKIFTYQINTSQNNELSFIHQDVIDEIPRTRQLFLNDLFSQSIYYITENGSSLRLKLFNIQDVQHVVQPITEQIFYSDTKIDFIEKSVIKVSDLLPKKNDYVFEITSPEFKQKISSPNDSQEPIKSEIGIIPDEENFYVNIPEQSTLHHGWYIVGIKNLTSNSLSK